MPCDNIGCRGPSKPLHPFSHSSPPLHKPQPVKAAPKGPGVSPVGRIPRSRPHEGGGGTIRAVAEQVDASRDKESPEHDKGVEAHDVILCEVQILTRSF